jgi:predicted transposase YdaD
MSFDNLCKLLAEKNPKTFTQWLVGHRPDEVTILKPELSIEPIRADSVTFLKAEGCGSSGVTFYYDGTCIS